MAEFKCFNCDKVVGEEYLRKKVRCPYCGYRILFKTRTLATHVKAE